MNKDLLYIISLYLFSCTEIKYVEKESCSDFLENYIERNKNIANFDEKYKILIKIKNLYANSLDSASPDLDLMKDLNIHKIFYTKSDHDKYKDSFEINNIEKNEKAKQEIAKKKLENYFNKNFVPEIISESSQFLKSFKVKDVKCINNEFSKTYNLEKNIDEIKLLKVKNSRDNKNFNSYYLVCLSHNQECLGFMKYDFSNYINFNNKNKFEKDKEFEISLNMTDKNSAYMDLFATSKDARGLGIGYVLNKLFEQIVTEKKGNKIEYIHLYTYNKKKDLKEGKNAPAYKFYTKNKYKNAYYNIESKKNGKEVDYKTVHMVKLL